jgi:UDP-N-acetyl-D-mannosaminuronic acid dehydrogenase
MFSNTDIIISRGHIMEDRYDLQNFRVLVIGLGQLGLPVAKYVKEKGFDA